MGQRVEVLGFELPFVLFHSVFVLTPLQLLLCTHSLLLVSVGGRVSLCADERACVACGRNWGG